MRIGETMAEEGPVLVVGAGIAGLTLALSLAARGIASRIYERAGHLEEVGAGLQLSPNASRILLALGLGPDLERTAVRPEAIVIRDARAADEIARLPLGAAFEREHGAPYLVVHRADLQAALLAAVRREPRIELHLGAVLEDVRDTRDGLRAAVVVGASAQTVEGRALVGADGVWSTVRTRILGGGAAVYSGRTAWRATFPAERWTGGLDLATTTGLWLGRDAHLVHYPVRAGREINVVAAVDDHWIDQRWDVVGDPADLDRIFGRWPEPVRRLLAEAGSWRKWALCGAPDGGSWTAGRVALIGDAAHGMLPFVAQGGAMAIEDAAVLARLLAEGTGTVPERLAAYVRARRPRVGRVVAAARRNADVYHLGGAAASARNFAMRLLGPARLLGRMEWIYGWRDAGSRP